MRYASTVAQDDLRARVRAFLADASPAADVRRLMETDAGHDPSVWESIVALGWLDLPFPDLAVVLEESGASLLCAPLLGTWLAAAAVAECGEGRTAWPAGAIAGLAVAEDSGRWDAESVTLRAVPSAGSGWRLDGHKSFVLDGHVAEALVVAGRTDAGVALFLVEGDPPGVSRALLPTVDQTRKLARLELSATPARLLGDRDGAAALGRILDLAATALAAEQVGGAGRCLEMTVDYVRRRVQFGRPIGSFQAVQHRCADMVVEVESARSASAWASHAAAARPPSPLSAELPRAASTAKVACSEAFAFVSTETIHLHGGLGFTWDHDAHLYFKRAKSSRQLFGDPPFHRDRLFRHLGL